MKTFAIPGLLFTSAALLILALTAVRAGNEPDPQTSSDREIRRLQDQVDALQTRLKTLEERLSELESVTQRMERKRPPAVAPNPPPFENSRGFTLPSRTCPGGKQRPEIWGTRELNGWTFYLIPCTREARPAGGVDPVVFK